MSVNEDKIKINIRVGEKLKNILEEEAAVEDLRIGTMANILVRGTRQSNGRWGFPLLYS